MRFDLARIVIIVLSVALLSCQAVAPPMGTATLTPDAPPGADTGSGVQGGSTVTPLSGRVDFGAAATRVQAIPGDVINLATISLIDTVTGQTRAAGITDADGAFTLPFATFVPASGSVYVLEAIKGLNAHLPGNDAPRFRTLVTFRNPGWASITNGAVSGRVVINALTTAIALVSGLDQAAMPYHSVMGMVNAQVSPPALTGSPAPPPSHNAAELLNLSADVSAILTGNGDPVGSTDAIKPRVDAVTPIQAPANAPVVIQGVGFVPGGTAVTIGGVSAPILSLRRYLAGGLQKWEMIVTVPPTAITGNLSVSTLRGGASNATPFTIPAGSAVSVMAISPNPARPGSTVTISGGGYSPVLAENDVRLNGVALTPIFANATTLVLVLPGNATSGNMTVTVNGAKSNDFALTLDVLATPQITSLFPNVGAVKSVVAIKGVNFGPSGKVVVGGYQAKVLSWHPQVVRVELPWYLAPGPTTLTLFGPFGVATANFTVIDGTAANTFVDTGTTMTGVGGNGTYVWVGDKKLWVWGGANSTAVQYINLLDDGGFADANWTTSPLMLPAGTNQDDNPNGIVQVGNRLYYTVSNSSNKVNFATLNPYTADVTGFGYDPTNDLPSSWLGKDLALAASEKYVYLLGQGVSCSGGGNCDGNPLATKQSRILPSGGIGIWENGPNNLYYGEDGIPLYIGGVLHLLGGTDSSTTGGSQFCVIKPDGTMGTWTTSSAPVVPGALGRTISRRPLRVGKYLYLIATADEIESPTLRGVIVDDLVPKPMSAYNLPKTGQGLNKVDVVIGRYLYSISSDSGHALQRKVFRCTLN
ncbi:IPT/TIG domain-containing protein [bacterium]|nr:IPT/TIG domain-containing protein [bacterium]